MKTLYLVRHAKSAWENNELMDIDRPLNDRGYRDAHAMSILLNQKENIPDLLISSPAIRAITTALIFLRNFKLPVDKLAIKDGIYESTMEEFLSVIVQSGQEHNNIMIFGHNSAITSVSNELSNTFIENIPTAGVVKITFNIDNWKEIKKHKGSLELFQHPKSNLK